MTHALIERLKELHAASTPGEWRYSPWHIEEGESAVRAPDGWIIAITESNANGEYIAGLHNALPDLLAELSRLRQSEAELREALTDARAKLAVAAESEAGDHELLLAAEAVLRQFISAQNDFLASVMPGVIDDPLTDVQIRAQEWLQTFRGPAALGEPK